MTIKQIFPFWWLEPVLGVTLHLTQQGVNGSLCLLTKMGSVEDSTKVQFPYKLLGTEGSHSQRHQELLFLPLVWVGATIF